jgi:hypothetical protein
MEELIDVLNQTLSKFSKFIIFFPTLLSHHPIKKNIIEKNFV